MIFMPDDIDDILQTVIFDLSSKRASGIQSDKLHTQ